MNPNLCKYLSRYFNNPASNLKTKAHCLQICYLISDKLPVFLLVYLLLISVEQNSWSCRDKFHKNFEFRRKVAICNFRPIS